MNLLFTIVRKNCTLVIHRREYETYGIVEKLFESPKQVQSINMFLKLRM